MYGHRTISVFYFSIVLEKNKERRCTFFFLRGQKEKVPKKKNPPTKTPAPLPAKGLTKRL